ncbi:hypothetical protein B0H11DRAFT_2221097 [Mycena galericulata]|nr:hypothetical protein B0H11DRAFT_2221097 [Mycena galericulata]
MNYVVDAAEFEDRWNTMLFTVSVNSTVLLLYALYVVLFIFSLYTLHQRKPAALKFLRVTSWLTFVLATCGILIVITTTGISMRMNYLLVRGSTDTAARLLSLYHALALAQDVILAVNNLVTDLLLLYRCYVIWGSRRRILVVPGLMMLATVVVACVTVLGYYHLIILSLDIDTRVPFIMGGATTILLTCLTGGRIWYIRREGRLLAQRMPRRLYDTAVAVILESGLLYCLCVIIYVISVSVPSSASTTIFNGVSWGLVQVGVNIVPTLIVVRVGLGRSTENTAPLSLSTTWNIASQIQDQDRRLQSVSFASGEGGRIQERKRRLGGDFAGISTMPESMDSQNASAMY